MQVELSKNRKTTVGTRPFAKYHRNDQSAWNRRKLTETKWYTFLGKDGPQLDKLSLSQSKNWKKSEREKNNKFN